MDKTIWIKRIARKLLAVVYVASGGLNLLYRDQAVRPIAVPTIMGRRILSVGLEQAKKVWRDDVNEMLETIEKLYQRKSVETWEKDHPGQKVLVEFVKIMDWSWRNPGQEELIRERITQIATRNLVNDTPQEVLPELEKFHQELQSGTAL